MYYITISTGLLDHKHQEKMRVNQKTSCIWVYLWLLDKITKIDLETGLGSVLGGKPIQVERDLKQFGDRKTIMSVLKKLEDEGYIISILRPYGKTIFVTKAKKSFGRQVEKRSPKSGTPIEESGTPLGENLVHLSRESGTPNRTVQYDKTVLDNKKSSPMNKIELRKLMKESGECFNPKQDVEAVIGAFAKVNPDIFRTWYKIKAQRLACDRLIDAHGLETSVGVAKALASSNQMDFFPRIYTPVQLEQKWQSLHDAYRSAERKRSKNAPIVLFS